MMTLEQQFESHILQQHQIAKDETGYKAPLFKRMVIEKGALQTAKDLLVGKNKISEGLVQLVLHKRLDLSLEANVIKPEWQSLFSDEELKTAIKRLKELNYPVVEILEKNEQERIITEVSQTPLFESGDTEPSTSNNQEITNQEPQSKEEINEHLPPERKIYETNTILRDQFLPRQIKGLYKYKCQIC